MNTARGKRVPAIAASNDELQAQAGQELTEAYRRYREKRGWRRGEDNSSVLQSNDRKFKGTPRLGKYKQLERRW